MNKTLLTFCAFFIFQFTFSQTITVSGSCTDTDALSDYIQTNGTDTQNGKPKYTGVNSSSNDCSQYVTESACNTIANTKLTYTIEWSGSNWEWVKTTTTGSFCVWLIEECVPAAQTGSDTTQSSREVLASNPADTPTPPCTGWTGDCAPTLSECATLGLISNEFDNQFTYYPNPTNDKFNIKFETPIEELTLNLTNVLGQVIMNKTYKNSKHIALNINQPAGIYFVKLTSKNNKEAYIKVMKN
ncbi:T9SS type A sorting domain-containing protein [Mangrovimonas spongiae]|uniref:T9SS C-terminal target domain-containing protein n=1 Tax=Mangrovimonas spongiae TaxID=2494697 RepID=A0A3R9MGE3_9FLAO|nr:T9SS type A sorting domain-containing protein [Mangrovimonas spongiae]RSK39846.1 T9SS C-terminal target domain-containing protein [Mangrovimonas spongiae]